MIDVILADNTRAACGGPQLIRYTAAGVFLALAKKEMDVRWVDLMSEGQGNGSAVPDQGSADVCCYAVFFGNKANALRLMNEARHSKNPPRRIIAFGPFASVFAEEILSRGLADMVVDSDPEFVIPSMLQQGDKGKDIHDLDEIPFISPFLYSQGHRPGLIMTARGCQYHCVFCDRNVLWGGGVRNRSVENVVKEIKELVEAQQATNIRFLDEDLCADRKRLAGICDGMRRIKGKFRWECSACVDSVNQEILLLMGRCGCKEIYFGVESASPQVLRKIGKKYGRQEIFDAVRWSQEAGLEVTIMITVGNPGETDPDRDLTLSALKELGPQVNVTTNRLVILPGTAFYRKGLREGWFTQKSFFEDEGIIFYDEKQGSAIAQDLFQER